MSDPGPVTLPPAVAEVMAAIALRGHDVHLVGPAVLALLEGEPARNIEIATPADGRTLLALFPKAIPLDGWPLRLMLPTADGAVDLLPHRFGGDVRAELAHRDFTIHALGAGIDGRVVDPFGGRADADAARLRCVGDPAERFAEDPLRMLRAARVVATRGLAADPGLVAAIRDASARLTTVPAARIREELHALLLGREVERGLALLRESGLEAVLAEGVSEEAARVVAAMPPDLELRLSAWLRGTRAVRILRRMREPWPRVIAVERLLHLHPIEALVPDESALRRLVRRSRGLLPGLLALREAEIRARGEGAEALRRVERVRRSIERATSVERADLRLALDGRAVMEILGCGPGPAVGRALAHLAKAVAADPACNTREALRERLLAWTGAGSAESEE